jgi:hypothetical protein
VSFGDSRTQNDVPLLVTIISLLLALVMSVIA